MTDNNGKALREAKAIYYALLTDKGAAQVGYDDLVIAFAALVEAVEAAPVADISEDGKHDGRSSLLNAAIAAGYYKGRRVRVLAVGEDG